MDFRQWQKRWDQQQDSYMADREQRFDALLDTIEVACGRAPAVLDLAGGTGSITDRLLARFPEATSVIVDIDPALLALAAGTFAGDRRVQVRAVDLVDPGWSALLAGSSFDAVVTATALHWLDLARVAGVYTEARRLLRSGGILANADHMADDGIGPWSERFAALRAQRAEQFRADTGATDWDGWWQELAAEPEMAPLVAERQRRFSHGGGSSHTESDLPVSWHLDALRAAGFAYAGVVWRGLDDALVVGFGPPAGS